MEASGQPNCIPTEEAAIDGYFPGQNKRDVSERTKPHEIILSQGEDDGGVYSETLMKFNFYQVSIVRERVDSVTIRSPKMIWAKKLKIGDARSRVDGVIGYAKMPDANGQAQYLVCSEVGDVYAVLRFSYDKLVNIEVAIDRP